MRQKINKLRRILVLLLIVVLLYPDISIVAEEYRDPMIVVSLGDSYSSGEGIEPFYGQDKKMEDKIKDLDWLAHRSKKSWPGLLQVPGYEGTMRDYRVANGTSSTEPCQWYFVAASGAVTSNVYSNTQEKKVSKKFRRKTYSHQENLPVQLDVFDSILGSVDYVTMTMGGNDVDFSGVINLCAKNTSIFNTEKLDNKGSLSSNVDEKLNQDLSSRFRIRNCGFESAVFNWFTFVS